MKQVKLSQGLFAYVDDQDFERVNKHKWYAEKRGKNIINYYAKRRIVNDGKNSTQSLHVFIMNGTVKGFEIDHKNGNGLDCQSGNLRRCTHSQNMGNQRKKANASSVFKGVSFNKQRNEYSVSIKVDGRTIHIGYCDNENEGACLYDQKAFELFGSFAWFNILNIKNINLLEYSKPLRKLQNSCK